MFNTVCFPDSSNQITKRQNDLKWVKENWFQEDLFVHRQSKPLSLSLSLKFSLMSLFKWSIIWIKYGFKYIHHDVYRLICLLLLMLCAALKPKIW